MSGKQIAIVILGAVVASVAVVLVIHLLGFRSKGTIFAGAVGGMVGALVAHAASRKR